MIREYIGGSPWVFLLITIIIGGGAAFMAGRSMARGWQPLAQLILFMVPLTAGVRFLHFALYQEELFSLSHFLISAVFLIACGVLGYRLKRADQMVTQYPWLYERSGPLSWRSKA
jgi:FtsH-binding integral membrane protein